MTDDNDDSRPDYADYTITEEGDERPDVEWIGIAGGSHDERPRLYEPSTETAYKGRFDHENDRVRLDPASGRDVETEAIGSLVESIGEWEWLSAYASGFSDQY